MKIYKLSEKAQIPEYATEGSACFDLRACFHNEEGKIIRIDPYNQSKEVPLHKNDKGEWCLKLHPSFRYVIPTGLIFSVPSKHVLKIYARSSVGIKRGLSLPNHVGVIDSDYVDETFVCLRNDSDTIVTIEEGERIAQAMVEKANPVKLEETKKRPAVTTRDGGIGSTGK